MPFDRREYSKKYYAANRERILEYHANNREFLSVASKAWRLANQARVAQTGKAWRIANRARNAATNKAWRLANLDRLHATQLAWRAANPERLRAINRKANYGLTTVAYNELLSAQGGVCAICKSANPGSRRIKTFHVDHDHGTGVSRGLLCHPCNTSLGGFRDDPVMLDNAAAYLRQHTTPRTKGRLHGL